MITLINHQGLKLVSGIQIQNPSPPIGLAYLGAYLKMHGHSYTAIDACGEALDQIKTHEDENILIQGLTISQIVEKTPEKTNIFGFTCLFSHVWPLVVNIATTLRQQFPNAIFIAGGEHPTAMPEMVFRDNLFDIAVLGEGEETFLELIEHIKNEKPWDSVSGIAYQDKEKNLVQTPPRKRMQDINLLPYPDWDSWCIENYISHGQATGINLGPTIPILGSRGCPYACTFCSNEDMWGRTYLMRDGKSITDEMEYMKNKYKVVGFSFMDSTFIINRGKTLEFCQELIERGLNISYQLPAGTRCEAFDEELAFALEQSGLKNFALAPESAAEEILKAIKKQIKLNNFFQAVRIIKKTKITVGCFIVIGFPEDTQETLKKSLTMIRRLALMGIDDITVSKFTPYPGSPYYKDFVTKGIIKEQLDSLSDIISFYSMHSRSYCDELTPKQLHSWMLWMFLNFYVISFITRPLKVIKNFWDYFFKGIENARYMRFFTEIFFLRRDWKKAHSTKK